MALVRLCYAAELPPPDEALRLLKEGAPAAAERVERAAPARPAGPSSSGNAALATVPVEAVPASRGEPQPGPRLRRFEDVVALAGERREIALKSALERDLRLVRFEEGRIEFALAEGASRDLPNDLKRALDDWTGRRWAVALSSEPGAATLHEQRQALGARAPQRRRRPPARAGGAVALPWRPDRRRAHARERGRGRSRSGAAGRSGGRRGSVTVAGSAARAGPGTTRPDQWRT